MSYIYFKYESIWRWRQIYFFHRIGPLGWFGLIVAMSMDVYIWEDVPWWLSHQKSGNFCPSLCPHCWLFNHIWSLLINSSEPIGRDKSFYAKIYTKNIWIRSAIKFKLSWIFGGQFFKSHISYTGRAFDLTFKTKIRTGP